MIRAARFKQAGKAAAIVIALAAPAGCAVFSSDRDHPAWFQERVDQLEKDRYPQLAGVPEATPSSRSDASWEEVRKSVEQAGAALDASPRATPPSGAEAAAGEFEAAARAAAASPRPER